MAVTRCALTAILGSMMLAAPLAAQSGTGVVTGRVLDSASTQPLASASVRIQGTTLGALTQADGSFRIPGVPVGTQQLRATRIGYAAQTRPVNIVVGTPATVTFSLTAQAAVLSDVVITGYGSAATRVDHRLGRDRERRGGQRRRRREREPASRRDASPA